MWKVFFSDESRSSIDWYVSKYQDYFLDIIDDTGIWSEELIRAQYVENAKKLRNILYYWISEKLSQDIIGHEMLWESWKTATIMIWGRICVVEYHEEEKTKKRFIESIRIIRRR